MRILVFTEYFPDSLKGDITGGVESRAFHLLQEIAQDDDVKVICSWQGPHQKRRQKIAGIDVVRVGPRHQYLSQGGFFSRLGFAISSFFAGLEHAKDRVLHGYSYLTYFITGAVALLKGNPSVATYHESWSFSEWVKLKGWFTGTLGFLWTWMARQTPFTRYVAVSEATKDRLGSQGLPKRRVRVIHNGVDHSFVGSIKSRKRKRDSIVAVSRLLPGKKLDVLLEAVSILKNDFGGLKLKIIGEGDQRESLERLSEELGVSDRVEFAGRLDEFADVIRAMKEGWIFCHPSEVEGFGMVIIEAMACGTPVVCSDIPVLKEVTDSGRGAVHFKAGNPQSCADALRKLLSDDDFYDKKKKEARKRSSDFRWDELAEKLRKVYVSARRNG